MCNCDTSFPTTASFLSRFYLNEIFWSDISMYLSAAFQEHRSCKDEVQTSEISASSSTFCLPHPSPLSFFRLSLWLCRRSFEELPAHWSWSYLKLFTISLQMKSCRARIFFLRRRIFSPLQQRRAHFSSFSYFPPPFHAAALAFRRIPSPNVLSIVCFFHRRDFNLLESCCNRVQRDCLVWRMESGDVF